MPQRVSGNRRARARNGRAADDVASTLADSAEASRQRTVRGAKAKAQNKNIRKKKQTRKRWYASSSAASSAPTSGRRLQRQRGRGSVQRGLGALAMAAAADTPASSQLKRIFTIVNGVADPATALGPGFPPGGQPPQQQQPQTTPSHQGVSAKDSLDDVRAYLATMNNHVGRLERVSGRVSPTVNRGVSRNQAQLKQQFEDLNLRRRPMTSPSKKHNSTVSGTTDSSNGPSPASPPVFTLSQHDHDQQQRRPRSSVSTSSTSGPRLVDLLRPGSPSQRRQMDRDAERSRSIHASVTRRRRQLSAQRTKSSPSATIGTHNLQVDRITGMPVVSGQQLRNAGPTFEQEMDFFVQLYIKRSLKPAGVRRIQAWRRGMLCRRKYVKWKTRRRLRLQESFRVWYLSQKFRSLKKRSCMRRCWIVWKTDHQDLAATKRLIGRLMKQNLKGNNAMMMNILTSAQGSAAMGDMRAHSTNAREREAFERMVADANRLLTVKCFEAWQYRVVQMQRLSKRVAVHLQRVQRQVLISRNITVMWPAERVGMLLKLWRRYTRFQRSVRIGAETDEPPMMQWPDLPQMDAWDEWVIDFEQAQIRAFKAASLGPMAVVRRMLTRMQLFVQLRKDERERFARASNHFRSTLCRHILYEWSEAARQRGKQMRLLRKVINVWWAYARREAQLRHRAAMVRSRLQDRQMGELLVQWRWRRCTHACVTATGLHYLLQPRNRFVLLRCIFAWRDTAFGDEHVKQGVHSPDRLQLVMLRCWRGWTRYVSGRRRVFTH